ncbi:MAG: AMP-binding protein [Pseudomonadota bacterium]|nr:AMP-binding protein [Pseudomonadota bacterium]
MSFSDIANLLREQAARLGEAVAIEAPDGRALSYAALCEKAFSIAGSLAAAGIAGDGKRPRVGIVMPNGLDMALTLLGTAVAAEATPFNPGSTASEFDAYFRATGIDALIVRDGSSGPAVAIAERLGIKLLRFGGDGRIAGYTPGKFDEPGPDNIALVLMTSGSTGKPKIVPLSHRNVCTSASEVAGSIGLSPEDACLTMWEQYHIGGLVDLLLAPLASGGRLIATAGFDAAQFFRILAERRPTWYQAVPTTLTELVFYAGRSAIAVQPNSLRLIRSVAAALAPSTLEEVEELFGVPVIVTLGMTEASPLITSTELPPAIRKRGSVGRSCGTQIRIVGPAGETLTRGATGEVAIRGDNVFKGYEANDEANAAQFRDGWFHTGDTGYLDEEGYLFLTGRIKQMVNRGGEKISPQEVDDALLTHPAVAEAASFAVPHRTLGEDIAAAVVLRTPVGPDELRAYLSTRVAAFKVPHRIAILDRMPRNPVGKIDRLALAEVAEKAEQDGAAHVPPRDELESFLTRLWARELDVEAVGIHDDFAALGGDSLSSMRILVAIESALDMSVPDEVFINYSTIAGIAGQLRERGARLRIDPEADADKPEARTDDEIGNILRRVEVGISGLEDHPEIVVQRIETCDSRDDFRILTDAMTVYCTPAELLDLLAHTRRARIGSKAAQRLNFGERLRLYLLNRRWRKRVVQEIRGGRSPLSWQRQRLCATVFHYASAAPASGKTLVVGFGGNLMRLMMPTYRVLANLDPDKVGLLLLRDTGRTGFMGGLDEVGDDLDEVRAYVEGIASEAGYRRIIALGTSGGAIAAMCMAARAGWPRAIAVAAASPARHADMMHEIERAAGCHDPDRTHLVLSFSAQSTRDLDASNQLKGIFQHAELAPEDGYDVHNLLDRLYQAGELQRYLGRWLD